MITKWIFHIAKFRNFFLGILFIFLDAQIVNFNVDSMSSPEEPNDIFSLIPN